MELEAVYLLVLISCWSAGVGQGQTAGDCVYRFTVEPLTTMLCNPYAVDELRTVCTVFGPREPYTIDWIWLDIAGNYTILSNNPSEMVFIDVIRMDSVEPSMLSITTRLRITGLMSVDHVGQYWCQVKLSNGTVVGDSRNRLFILDRNAYSLQNLSDCVVDENCSKESEDCITSVPSTDSSNPLEEESTTVNSNQATSLQPQTPPPTDEPGLGPALYSIIGVIAVFVVVIISLTVTIVVLYRRKCAQIDIKPADHSTINPYGGFTQTRERINSNGSSRAERPHSVTSSTYSHPHQHTTHSPGPPLTSARPPNYRADPYSKLIHASNKCSLHSLSGELLPEYSKLSVVDGPVPLSPQPDDSKLTQPTMEVAPNQRASRIYSDLDDKDLETGIRGRKQFSPPLSIYNTLEGPGRHANRSRPNTRACDYEIVVSASAQDALKSPAATKHNTLFDDPDYFPVKQPAGKSKVEILDRRYIGNYERSPTYTCPTVIVGVDKLHPKYRGNYEWDPMYAPTPPPRRVSVSSNHTQSVSNTQDEKVKVQCRRSLESEVLYKYSGDYERCPTYEPPVLKERGIHMSQVLGRKYSGNYERDPVYMANHLKRVEDENSAGESSVCSSRLDSEDSVRLPHARNTHEFVTLVSTRRDSIERLDSLEPPFIEIPDTFEQGTFIDI